MSSSSPSTNCIASIAIAAAASAHSTNSLTVAQAVSVAGQITRLRGHVRHPCLRLFGRVAGSALHSLAPVSSVEGLTRVGLTQKVNGPAGCSKAFRTPSIASSESVI